MNFFASLLNGFTSWVGSKYNKIIYHIGISLQGLQTNGVTGLPEKIATVFTCCRILSENLARMPISVILDNETGRTELKRHRLYYLLRYQPNQSQNAQQFWSTIEFHRNKYGIGLARIHKNADAYPVRFEIIHPGQFKSYYKTATGELYFIYTDAYTQEEVTISNADLLIFRNISEDGIWGLSTLAAIERQTNINERALSTLDNFHKNNAMSPMALKTRIPDNASGPAIGAMVDSKKQFGETYAGPDNAGKIIELPFGSEIQQLPPQLADAELIQTLKFTREDISAAFGVLLGMIDGSFEKMDVEQLTTLFKNNTMGPIVAIYIAELMCKLLTRDEILSGQSIIFDVTALIGMDYQKMVMSIKEQVVNGMMTPNEGARKLGNTLISGPNGNMHYMQAQYIQLENYEKQNPLQKNDPTTKTQ